jgi:hypothetical protein
MRLKLFPVFVVAFSFIAFFSGQLRAETFGSKFSRCVVNVMHNNATTEDKAWKLCESVAQEERDKELKDQNPGDTARAARLARQLGAPPEAAKDNLTNVEKGQKLDSYERMISSTPKKPSANPYDTIPLDNLPDAN